MPARFPGPTSPSMQWGWVLLIFGLVLLCYWPALHGALLWDDRAHVTKLSLQSWSGLGRIWTEVGATQQYYPVLHSAFWIEHRLWAEATLGYHLWNVVCHATSACLLAIILRHVWSAQNLKTKPDGDQLAWVMPAGTEWLAALIFAVHPVNVESVAWISEQKNTLSLLFYLLAALVYFNFSENRRPGSYVLALGLFILALGAKSVTATLPAAFLVVLWWKNGRLCWRRDIFPLVPWFGLALVSGVFTAWVERTVIGAEGQRFDFYWFERTLLAGRIVWFYFLKLIWPADLAFFYPHWDVHSAASGWCVYLGALVLVTFIFWKLRRRTRGLLAVWLLFVGSLFPALGFFNVFPFLFSYVADHFQYLASLGLIAGMIGGASLLASRAQPWVAMGARACACFLVIALVYLSHRQSGLYRDDETLFTATLTQTPDSWMAHHILGFTLAKSSARQADAIAQYREALRINPEFPDAHVGLGVMLAAIPTDKPDAVAHYERALELRPHYAEAHNDLAVELAKMPGRLPEALLHYGQAIRIRPDFAEALFNFANALTMTPGRVDESLARYSEALRLRPDYAEAHHGLALVLAGLPGRMPEAFPHYEEAIRLRPGYAEAHYDYANALLSSPGRTDEALAHYNEALRLDPNSAVAHYNLANTLAHLRGRLPEALPHYVAAIRLKPDFADAHANFGNALSALGGHEIEALGHYESALRISPNLALVHYNLALLLARVPGRQADAIGHGESAVRLKPDYLEGYNGLAIIYAQQGRLEDARICWEKALRLNPAYEAARQNLELLQRMRK